MVHAIRIHRTGGPDVMQWEEVTLPPPTHGEVRIKHTAIGVNYIDTYHRSGLYPIDLPAVLGMEAAGVVEEAGPNVNHLRPGDRVAYADPRGAYAEARNIPASRLVPIPANIADGQAASMMLKGMTAEYLLLRTRPVQKGETILVHAAAGGVGLILCQWARHLGATVIGTVGSEEKAELARAHGCHHTILYRQEDFVARTRELTDGKGVPVVYDAVGKDTFMKSLECLRPRGMMVSYGQASGPVPPLDVGVLSARGSLYLTRPSLMVYNAARDDLLASAKALFDVVGSGAVKVDPARTLPLKEAARAHLELQARKTTGSTVLIP